MRYDVIIIGSGLGGLVCGLGLAQQGKSVLVLERQIQPGGCLQSYKRHGGLSFDTGLHYVGGLTPGHRIYDIFSYLGLMDLPWYQMDESGFDLITIGDKTYPLASGYDNFVDTLSQYFPKERESLRKYVKMLQDINRQPITAEALIPVFGKNAYEYLTETFSDPLLVNILAGSSIKLELRKESLPLFTFAHSNSSYISSSWRLRGDGNMMIDKLVSQLRANGGELICKAEVEEIIEHEGRITSVRCSNGETYEGDIFISDIHPTLTFDLIKESSCLKPIFRKRMANIENTIGAFTVSLVLKPQVLEYFNHNKFIYRKANVWEPSDESQPVDRVMVSCIVPKEGKYATQIDLLTHMTWNRCKKWENTTIGHRGDDYKAMKAQVARECIELAETQIPGLSDMIATQYTSSPLTWHDYNLSPLGSAYGMRKDHRNMLTILSPRTPISNLLLTGQNLTLHGIEGVMMTAVLTCAEILGPEHTRNIINL